MKNVNKKIKQARQNKEYSQEYMADKIGISQKAYSNLENGHTKITLERLNKIVYVLEINIQDLLG